MSDILNPTSSSATTDTPVSAPLALFRFGWDCGRNGNVEGLFITDHATVDAAIGKNIYFGEILGKHSEIYGVLERADLTIVTEDQEFLAKMLEYVGSQVSGYNPLSYLPDAEE